MITHFNSVLLVEDQSMDYPTTDYFVYSSHNTYLKGHQLYGDSSVEMYAYAINLGCRCVELDCWDGPNNEPKITHGMTFTSDILFKDVLKNIKDNAFKKTESPFFLSIEMHCGDEQQKIMAGYFKTILVDCWIPENDGNPSFFPTPNEMKNKFIVKCKKPRVFRTENRAEKYKTKNVIEDSERKHRRGPSDFNVEKKIVQKSEFPLKENKKEEEKKIEKKWGNWKETDGRH